VPLHHGDCKGIQISKEKANKIIREIYNRLNNMPELPNFIVSQGDKSYKVDFP